MTQGSFQDAHPETRPDGTGPIAPTSPCLSVPSESPDPSPPGSSGVPTPTDPVGWIHPRGWTTLEMT